MGACCRESPVGGAGSSVDGVTLEQALISFAVVAGLITLVPGLDTALVLQAGLTADRRNAAWTAVGVSAGVLVWGVAAAAGVAALLTASRFGYDVVRYLGAAYLVFLGGRLLIAAARRTPHQHETPPLERSAGRSFQRGLLTNLLNPKVGVFYLATLPQFLVAGVPPLVMGATLAAVHVLLGAVWFGFIIAAARFASRWLRRPAVARTIDGFTGTVLIAFGVRTALEAR